MGSPGAHDLDFQAPRSVWAELQAKLAPAEVHETVSILGQALIDRNDGLHQELSTLLDILREYTAEVDGKAQRWRARLSHDTNCDMLTTEIRSFISALRSKTSTPISLRPSTPHDRAVLDYVLHEDENNTQSARQLLASRGGASHRGVPPSVGEQHERPGTAEVAGRLVREIAARGGVDAGCGKVTLEALEREAQRFQQVLEDEATELTEHISFLHQVLEAEQDRDKLHSGAPSSSDLKDLREKLHTELTFVAAEDRIARRAEDAVAGKKLAPLAPHCSSANTLDASSGSLRSRAVTPLCPAPLPALPSSRGGGDIPLHAARSCALYSSDGNRGSAGAEWAPSEGSDVTSEQNEVGAARPLTAVAVELGLELDSDEDAFLFGDEDAPRAVRASQHADVLVVSDDDDDEECDGTGDSQGVSAQRPPGRARKASMSCTHDVPDRGAQEGKVASAASGSERSYALELEAQSKELRMLLSGLASRDTLAAPPALGGLDEAGAAASPLPGGEDAASAVSASAGVRVAGTAGLVPGAGASGRRVSLGRHRSLIDQVRSGEGREGGERAALPPPHSAARAPPSAGARAAPAVTEMMASSAGAGGKGRAMAAAPNVAASRTRVSVGARGPSRGLASSAAPRSLCEGTPPANGSGGPTDGTRSDSEPSHAGLQVLGGAVGGRSQTAVASPAPPPPRKVGLGVDRAPPRLRPIYTRPSAAH